ncbi:hypothetical protein MRB53_040799 [Persea americana]|nr:hypothetical protein MRB53_040799 [Persea americana]
MPAKRRQNQPQPAIHSDYDTESAVPLPTTAPKRSIQELNYTVLSRYVPGLRRIVSIASFTVVYVFSPGSQQWEKSGVEGTLFLCQTSDGASIGYSVVILNRKSLDNFITHLTSADDVELTDEYVILQGVSADGAPRIYGLWIFSEAETVPSTKELVGLAIQECAMRIDQVEELREAEEDAYEEPYEEETISQAAGRQGQSIDVATLFSKPQIQPETHIRPTTQTDEAAGQRLDLLKLFGQPQIQAEEHIQPQQQAHYHPVQQPIQHQFQQHSQGQAHVQPQYQGQDRFQPQIYSTNQQSQQPQQSQQQTTLLNLFKTGNG